MIQGVRDIFEIVDKSIIGSGKPDSAENSKGKIVLIGRGLMGLGFEESLLGGLR